MKVCAKLDAGRPANSDIRVSIISQLRALDVIRRRLKHGEDFAEPIKTALNSTSTNVSNINIQLRLIEELFLAEMLEEHFLDEGQAGQFDTIDWSVADQQSVLDLFEQARRLILSSGEIEASRKDRATYFIHRAEVEVRKEQGRWTTFLGAANEALETVGKNGGKIAAAIQAARTKTMRNVVEMKQIEAEAKPKQIEDKSESTKS